MKNFTVSVLTIGGILWFKLQLQDVTYRKLAISPHEQVMEQKVEIMMFGIKPMHSRILFV
jgi:hypothetical protein